ncbi:hypothetical protein EJ07DRAFT_162716 [Lizonia empirigonia]|nr:hypothetical protein EJ07DRAFT_162716 [Lizonia empirigonia]
MSLIISNAARLKPEIRLAEAVSQFEASLSADQKTIFHNQRARSLKNPPDTNDVMRVTAEIDRCVSGKAGKRCFGPRFTNFLQGVQQFAALGDVVGGSQNIIACGVWSLERMSLLSIINFSLYMDSLSSLFMEIGRSAPRYQTIAVLYPLSKTLQAHIIEYFIVVVHLCHSIRQFSLKSTLDGWEQSIKEDVGLLVAKRVEEEAHNNSKFRALSHIFSKTASRQQKMAAKLKVLDLCSEYGYETTWKQIRNTGCGKSVTMANIVEGLHVQNGEGNATVAYFFCRHDLQESLKARTVIGALVRQLLLPLQDLPDLTDSKSHIKYRRPLDYESMATLLNRSCLTGHKRYIVLDGLDLCKKPVMTEILEQLQNLQKQVPILLCVSLRQQPQSSLQPAFQDWTILSADSSSDIEAFTESELVRYLESGTLKIDDPALILDVQDSLIKGSKGMFLWVVLQIKSLCSMSTDKEIKEALTNLPVELPDIYTQVLQKVQEPDKIHQKKMLELITAARRPLKLEEMQEATSVTPGDTEWSVANRVNDVYLVLASCGCLLTLDEEELTVRLLHPSVEQFVFDRYRDSTGARVFGTEISKFCAPKIEVGLAPSNIIASTVTPSTGHVQKLALKLLKMRKQSNFDVGRAFSKELAFQKKPEKAFEFHLYQYAKRWYNSLGGVRRTVLRWIWFCYAAYMDEKRVVMSLLDKGTLDFKYNNRHGKTPLLYAIQQGHRQMSEILVQAKCFDVNAGIGELTPVLLATQSRNATALEALLKSGGLRLTEKEGDYLLSLAKTCGDERIEALIAQGSESNWNLAPPPSPNAPLLLLFFVLIMFIPEALVAYWWFFSSG